MWQACLAMLQWVRGGYQRRLERALSLHTRGEVRPDGVRLRNFCTRLEIQLWARDIHPWDRERRPEGRGPLFAEQLLSDTEAVIARLFRALPQIDVIALEVLDPVSEATLLAGTVEREVWNGQRSYLSVRMRLRQLGVTCESIG